MAKVNHHQVTMVGVGLIDKVKGEFNSFDAKAKFARKFAKRIIELHGYPEALRRAKMVNAGELAIEDADKFLIHLYTEKAKENANNIIERFKGCPKDHEFYMLKGVLLAVGDCKAEVNTSLIAERMDAINAEAMKSV